ncbi:MAG TPA: ParB/RepB/Spo0J family partition protein [Candidatus Dormibacteraeota bacterium]|nr:ParB/RepB/Spo0J family partition protein [Candidatus Dormibacteraeota bacterium]
METKRRGLGRGLESLIPLPTDRHESGVPQLVAIDQIRPSDQQVRRSFDPEALRELAESIRSHGLLQPLLLRRLADGYQLLAGERRWRAARLAGVDRVPALVRDEPGEAERLVLGLIENLQRQDLNPIEEAHGIRALSDQFRLTQEEIAARLGRNRVSIAQALRLLTACPAVQSAVAAGALTAGHARALVGLPGFDEQEHGLKVVLGRRLSVRQTEAWVKRYLPPRPRLITDSSRTALARLAAELEAAIGLSVKLTGSPRRGKVAIAYGSQEDLQRLYGKLTS